MTDLNENASDLTDNDVGNTGTQGHFTDADIDAINAAWAEAESGSIVAENATVESELFGISGQLQDEPVNFSDRLEPEPEPKPLPWADAPENTIYYGKMYEDGHLGGTTEAPEMAYLFGWYENRISKDDVKQSDINGFLYLKDKCPMKTADDISRDEAKARIFELKNFLAATDYKAIKYAEGALTADEYEPDRQARADARAEINRLEASL